MGGGDIYILPFPRFLNSLPQPYPLLRLLFPLNPGSPRNVTTRDRGWQLNYETAPSSLSSPLHNGWAKGAGEGSRKATWKGRRSFPLSRPGNLPPDRGSR